jgi:hypothetical protein
MKKEKKREKVIGSEMEYINEVADDCILNMSEKDKEYLIDNPRAIVYHFTYCMYIRNHYIYNRDFSEATFGREADDLSSKIVKAIFSKLLPEYIYGNGFIEYLYDNKGFIQLRRAYKDIYGDYPVGMVEGYLRQTELEIAPLGTEVDSVREEDLQRNRELLIEKDKIYKNATAQLIKELAESVWRMDDLKALVAECGILYDDISEKIEQIKNIFYEKSEYIPLETCLLPYKKEIGKNRYLTYRRALCKQLSNNPYLIEKLDKVYFYDRVLAKSALKCGYMLQYLPMYQDDDVMVKYSLKHDGEAIQYAAERFQQDREWVKFAIEHSESDTIMSLDCMAPYRKDKELVYLACKVSRRNFEYVDKSYRDDFELAKICIEQYDDPTSFFCYLSKRLRDNKELVMLNLQVRWPEIETYSTRLRNDDEVAAKLYELHGDDSWIWRHMSKRLKKKYGIEELQMM